MASPRHPETLEQTLDTAQRARLTAMVSDWHLSEESKVEPWQARIADRRAGRGWGARLGLVGRSTAAALTLTLIVALVAALLNTRVGLQPTPSQPPSAGAPAVGGSTSPSRSAHPRPLATPLPSLAAFGPAIAPRSLLVQGIETQAISIPGGQVHRLAASPTGTTSAQILPLPDGRYLCACGQDTVTAESYTHQVTVKIMDASGAIQRSFSAGTYLGTIDPTVSGAEAATYAALSPDGTTLLQAYAFLTSAGWQVGIDVYDLASGARQQRFSLGLVPLVTTTALSGIASPIGWGPLVEIAPDGRHLVLALPTAADNATVVAERWWSAALSSDRLSSPVAFPPDASTLKGTDCLTFGSTGLGLAGAAGAFASTDLYVEQCGYGSQQRLRRMDLTGRSLGDVALPADFGQTGPAAAAIDTANGIYYGWDPFSGRLLRIDVATGQIDGSVLIAKPSAETADPLAALGRWLGPSALAKTDLAPAMALSPDGGRLYLIGSTADAFAAVGTSTGVQLVDARTLALLDHWPPSADLDSVAVSGDGNLVYALGAPAQGQPASLTVYDAAGGQVRLVMGDLGSDQLTFSGPRQP
jgi:hypothetical protein